MPATEGARRPPAPRAAGPSPAAACRAPRPVRPPPRHAAAAPVAVTGLDRRRRPAPAPGVPGTGRGGPAAAHPAVGSGARQPRPHHRQLLHPHRGLPRDRQLHRGLADPAAPAPGPGALRARAVHPALRQGLRAEPAAHRRGPPPPGRGAALVPGVLRQAADRHRRLDAPAARPRPRLPCRRAEVADPPPVPGHGPGDERVRGLRPRGAQRLHRLAARKPGAAERGPRPGAAGTLGAAPAQWRADLLHARAGAAAHRGLGRLRRLRPPAPLGASAGPARRGRGLPRRAGQRQRLRHPLPGRVSRAAAPDAARARARAARPGRQPHPRGRHHPGHLPAGHPAVAHRAAGPVRRPDQAAQPRQLPRRAGAAHPGRRRRRTGVRDPLHRPGRISRRSTTPRATAWAMRC